MVSRKTQEARRETQLFREQIKENSEQNWDRRQSVICSASEEHHSK